MHLLTLRGFNKGLWQSTINNWNFEGKPKCKHFDSPSGGTEGRRRPLFLMCWHSTQQIHRSLAPLILLLSVGCLSLEVHYSYSWNVGYLVPRSALLIFFKYGLSCPSKCTAHILRVRAFLSLELLVWASTTLVLFDCERSCPSNRSFGLATPWYYSSAGVFVPRIAPSGQQRLGII
jgi:hypothetical protein